MLHYGRAMDRGGTTSGQVLTLASIAAFVYLTAVILVMASERMYWYWAGFTPESVLALGVFYAVPAAVALWAMALVPSYRTRQVVLAGAVFAFIVEGVLTPVIYTDGPLPVLAALFVGWHGIIAFFGFWYLARSWLLQRKLVAIGIACVGFGVLWGVWAFIVAVRGPAELADASETIGELLVPRDFALYAFGVGAVLTLAHWLIGFVWPSAWQPGRISTWLLALATFGYMVIAVIPAVIWAPIKLAVLLGGTYWLMRRHSRDPTPNTPTVLDALVGRVRFRDALVLLLLPVSASLVYAATWELAPSPSTLSALYWIFVAGQVLGGLGAFVWAARPSIASASSKASPLPTPRQR